MKRTRTIIATDATLKAQEAWEAGTPPDDGEFSPDSLARMSPESESPGEWRRVKVTRASPIPSDLALCSAAASLSRRLSISRSEQVGHLQTSPHCITPRIPARPVRSL